MLDKLKSLKKRYEELSALLAQPETMNDQKRYRELAREHAQLSEIVAAYDRYTDIAEQLADCREMLSEQHDPEMRELIHAELSALEASEAKLEEELKFMLLPRDPNDARDVIIEIRAGTGGDEAALFGADLLRMYQRYAERHGFKTEFLNETMTEMGGVKEVVLSLSGQGAYSRMKYESGACLRPNPRGGSTRALLRWLFCRKRTTWKWTSTPMICRLIPIEAAARAANM